MHILYMSKGFTQTHMWSPIYSLKLTALAIRWGYIVKVFLAYEKEDLIQNLLYSRYTVYAYYKTSAD